MKPTLHLAAFCAISLPAFAQIVEIPGMTVSRSVVDMDTSPPLALGPTTVAALRAAGTNGGAPIGNITLTANTAAQGFYNSNPELGRALGFNATTNRLVILAPLSTFDAFNAQIDLLFAATEFGIAIGDWVESMVLDFSFLGQPVGTITTSRYDTANAKFFHSPALFDRVNVRATSTLANWVIPELHIQLAERWSSFGTGCTGSNGIPTIDLLNHANISNTYRLSVTNMPLTGGTYAMSLGFNDTFLTGLGPLPFDLAPFGAPGCAILIDVVTTVFLVNTAGTGTYSLAIPNQPAFAGLGFINQAFVFDPPANTLGVTTSNACRALVL